MTPRTQKARIDKFSRFLVLKEQANRRGKKPGFYQAIVDHPCGTPACIGGYLDTYAPYRTWLRNQHERDADWMSYTGLNYGHFSGDNPAMIRDTALMAANRIRKAVGLKPFAKISDARK